jgi:hypothetical protein
MSPVMRPVSLYNPSHVFDFSGIGGGTINATGSPLRVTRIGRPVCFTFFSRLKQVALNLEMVTFSSIMKMPL